MARSPRARIASLRRQLVISRDEYLAAVARQERRAEAKLSDPRRLEELRKRILETKRQLARAAGEDVTEAYPTQETHPADPALFDSDEDIVHDERLIGFYLADNPREPRRPNARGRNHEELLRSWMESTEGKKVMARRQQWFAEAFRRLRLRLATSGDA